MKNSLLLAVLVVFSCCLFSTCKKDKSTDKIAYTPEIDIDYSGVPTIIVENYVNRLYIDLLGREPTDAEMDADVAMLEAADLSMESRESLIDRLQSGTGLSPGDTVTYQEAYYHRLYDVLKAKFIDGATDYQIESERLQALNSALDDSASGNLQGYLIKIQSVVFTDKMQRIPEDLLAGEIDVNEVFKRMTLNAVYDFLNMNSFNYVNACFHDLYGRFPTQAEYDKAYDMVEYSNPNSLFGMSGQTKGDFNDIMVHSDEFYEGIVRWLFKSYVRREPTAAEVYDLHQEFKGHKDYQKLQEEILKMDEYADFD